MRSRQTDVLVVGAGPAGLTLANWLAGEGIDCLVVDRLAEGQNTSRAAAIQARTLEVLAPLGVSEMLVEAGLRVPLFTVRDRDEQLAQLDFSRLPTAYPFVLLLPQAQTEAILAHRLAQHGRAVLRRHEAVAVTQDAAEVRVTVRAEEGEESIRARYVVAADGAHSMLRGELGIGFDAGTYAQSFVLGDVAMAWPSGAREVELFLSEAGLMVVAPFSADRFRIVATMDEAPEQPDRRTLQALLDARGPAAGAGRIHEVLWSSRFRVHHGVAAHYRCGRVLLLGDAAHVHSPAGGQGMNLGIQDACDLAPRLVRALREPAAAEEALDGYERTRRPIAEEVVRFTDQMTRVATLKGAARRTLRNGLIEALGHVPALRRHLAQQLAELDPQAAARS